MERKEHSGYYPTFTTTKSLLLSTHYIFSWNESSENVCFTLKSKLQRLTASLSSFSLRFRFCGETDSQDVSWSVWGGSLGHIIIWYRVCEVLSATHPHRGEYTACICLLSFNMLDVNSLLCAAVHILVSGLIWHVEQFIAPPFPTRSWKQLC